MDFLDFLQRHWMLAAAAVGILFMLIASEISRLTRKYAEIGPAEASRMMSHSPLLILFDLSASPAKKHAMAETRSRFQSWPTDATKSS